MTPTFATKVTDSVCKWVSGSIVLLTSALKSLNGYFLSTDWGIFKTGTSSPDEAADAASFYINFCVDNVVR